MLCLFSVVDPIKGSRFGSALRRLRAWLGGRAFGVCALCPGVLVAGVPGQTVILNQRPLFPSLSLSLRETCCPRTSRRQESPCEQCGSVSRLKPGPPGHSFLAGSAGRACLPSPVGLCLSSVSRPEMFGFPSFHGEAHRALKGGVSALRRHGLFSSPVFLSSQTLSDPLPSTPRIAKAVQASAMPGPPSPVVTKPALSPVSPGTLWERLHSRKTETLAQTAAALWLQSPALVFQRRRPWEGHVECQVFGVRSSFIRGQI